MLFISLGYWLFVPVYMCTLRMTDHFLPAWSWQPPASHFALAFNAFSRCMCCIQGGLKMTLTSRPNGNFFSPFKTKARPGAVRSMQSDFSWSAFSVHEGRQTVTVSLTGALGPFPPLGEQVPGRGGVIMSLLYMEENCMMHNTGAQSPGSFGSGTRELVASTGGQGGRARLITWIFGKMRKRCWMHCGKVSLIIDSWS